MWIVLLCMLSTCTSSEVKLSLEIRGFTLIGPEEDILLMLSMIKSFEFDDEVDC